MVEIYVKLFCTSLIAVLASSILYLLKKKTKFGEIPHMTRQVIIGVIFGLIAIYGTEFGVDVGGAVVNARDAAPLCAGLLFGGPAGIIAGLIGGIERWFCVYWGGGEFTRIACSVSTILAGLYAAYLRKNFFNNRRPSWFFGLCSGVVMEVIHLTLVFVTNFQDSERAYEVVKICTAPMIFANAISVAISCIFLSIFTSEINPEIKIKNKDIAARMQIGLLVVIVVGYFVTTLFTYGLQTATATANTKELLELNVTDVAQNIEDASDTNILNVTGDIKRDYEENTDIDLNSLKMKYKVSEINIVGSDGIIYKSTNPGYIGFDMKSGDQAKEFMVLLGGAVYEYVQPFGQITYSNNLSMKYAGKTLSNGKEFVQVGYNLGAFQDLMKEVVNDITENRHIDNTGYVIVSDIKGKVVSNGSSYDIPSLSSIRLSLQAYEANTVFDRTVYYDDVFMLYQESNGYIIIAVLPKVEAFDSRDKAVYVNSFMEVIVFAALFFITYRLVKNIVVDDIQKVNRGLGKITSGDLSQRVDIRNTLELESLSDAINQTVDALEDYIDKEKTRIDKELGFAKNIQMSALPSRFPAYPNVPEFDIYATMDTAKEVGGDFYDFYMLDNDKLGFLIADVSGKGIPAAMFMMQSKTIIKAIAEEGLPVEEVLTLANDRLCATNAEGMFVTCWMGILDINTGELNYVCAGHNPPLIKRADGNYEYLGGKRGFVLAGMEGFKYVPNTITLNPNDRIYLYTDGVTEATDIYDELYGEDRLQNFLNENKDKENDELLKLIKSDIDVFVKGREQFDDITMLALTYLGSSVIQKTFAAKIEELNNVNDFIEEAFDKVSDDLRSKMQILVSVEEIFVNVAHYAYKGKDGDCQIILDIKPNEFNATFIDTGIPFNPLKKEDPDITLSAEERGIGGLGIYMVKEQMDSVSYEYRDDMNILKIRKVLN